MNLLSQPEDTFVGKRDNILVVLLIGTGIAFFVHSSRFEDNNKNAFGAPPAEATVLPYVPHADE